MIKIKKEMVKVAFFAGIVMLAILSIPIITHADQGVSKTPIVRQPRQIQPQSAIPKDIANTTPMIQQSHSTTITAGTPAMIGLVDYATYPINFANQYVKVRDWTFNLPSDSFVNVDVSGYIYAPDQYGYQTARIVLSLDSWGLDWNTFRIYNAENNNYNLETGFQTNKVYWLPAGSHTVHIWTKIDDASTTYDPPVISEISVTATVYEQGNVDVNQCCSWTGPNYIN